MFEIKSCDVTIDVVADKFSAYNIYNRCVGPEVAIYQYNQDGNKYMIAKKLNNAPGNHSKSPVVPVSLKAA